MAKTTLSAEMREQRATGHGARLEVGPFLTISRQYGCHGYALGAAIKALLAEDYGEHWGIYHKEILSRLATETNLARSSSSGRCPPSPA